MAYIESKRPKKFFTPKTSGADTTPVAVPDVNNNNSIKIVDPANVSVYKDALSMLKNQIDVQQDEKHFNDNVNEQQSQQQNFEDEEDNENLESFDSEIPIKNITFLKEIPDSFTTPPQQPEVKYTTHPDFDPSYTPPPHIEQSTDSITFPSLDEQALTGFTPDNVKKIYDNIKIGLNLTDCAKLLRIPSSRIIGWYNRNYHNFKFQIDEAYATNKLIHVGRVTNAKDYLHVKASTWMLERKYKDEYTKETIVHVNQVMIDNIARVTVETLIQFIKDPDMLQLATTHLRNNLSQITTQVTDDHKIKLGDGNDV